MEHKLKINEETKTVETIAMGDNAIQATIDSENIDVSYGLISDHQLHLCVNGINLNAFVMDTPEGKTVLINGIPYLVEDALTLRTTKKRSGKSIPTEVTPVTPSVVISVQVKAGDTVKKGQGVIVLSAMKMETTLTAPFDGTVAAVNVAEGESVSPGQVLVDIQRDAEAPAESAAP